MHGNSKIDHFLVKKSKTSFNPHPAVIGIGFSTTLALGTAK